MERKNGLIAVVVSVVVVAAAAAAAVVVAVVGGGFFRFASFHFVLFGPLSVISLEVGYSKTSMCHMCT